MTQSEIKATIIKTGRKDVPTKKNGSGGEQPYDEKTGRFQSTFNKLSEKGYTRNEIAEKSLEEREQILNKEFKPSEQAKRRHNITKDTLPWYDYKTDNVDWTFEGEFPKRNGIFDTKTLGGFTNYDRDLADKNNIVMITPREYFKLTAKGFGRTYEEEVKNVEANKENINHLMNVLFVNNKKFPMTWIDLQKPDSQEGRHRMLVAAKAVGWDTPQPVLAVNGSATQKLSDEQKEKYGKFYKEYKPKIIDIEKAIQDNKILEDNSTLNTRQHHWGSEYKDYNIDPDEYKKASPIMVTERNGKLLVEDGRHRLVALKNGHFKNVEVLYRKGE